MRKSQQHTLINPSLDELMDKVDNKYILSLLIAKRARMLADGDAPVTDQVFTNKVTTAIEEISEGKVVPYGPEEAAETEEN